MASSPGAALAAAQVSAKATILAARIALAGTVLASVGTMTVGIIAPGPSRPLTPVSVDCPGWITQISSSVTANPALVTVYERMRDPAHDRWCGDAGMVARVAVSGQHVSTPVPQNGTQAAALTLAQSLAPAVVSAIAAAGAGAASSTSEFSKIALRATDEFATTISKGLADQILEIMRGRPSSPNATGLSPDWRDQLRQYLRNELQAELGVRFAQFHTDNQAVAAIAIDVTTVVDTDLASSLALVMKVAASLPPDVLLAPELRTLVRVAVANVAPSTTGPEQKTSGGRQLGVTP